MLVDEQDYVMRLIHEMVRLLFSLLSGRQYREEEAQVWNKYEVGDRNLDGYRDMVDEGRINEAENLLLEALDYSDPKAVLTAALVYQYIGGLEEDFLKEHDYSAKEAAEGLRELLRRTGYGEAVALLAGNP